MAGVTASWTRLIYDPVSGELTVHGNPFPVLGLTDSELVSSPAPLSLLPDTVSGAMLEGTAIITDEQRSLLIIPEVSPSVNAVTVIREPGTEGDYVSDIAAGVVGIDANGVIARWNRRMTHLFGPREEDAKGKSAEVVLPQPALYNWRSVVSSAMLGHEVRVEFRPSGEKRVEGVLSRGGPGVIGLFYDSTENYRTGKRLRASNRLNQAYLQSTGIGILLLDGQQRILLSNRGFAGIFREEGSLIGLHLKDVLPEDSCRWIHESSEKLSTSHLSELVEELDTVGSQGGTISVRHTLRVIKNESNQPVNFVCLFEDRTELNSLGNRAECLKDGLTALTLIAEGIREPSLTSASEMCAAVMNMTGASAVAQYGYDRYDSMRLQDKSGAWKGGLPPEEPAGLGFPSYVWTAEKCCTVESHEQGVLADTVEKSIVVPMGKSRGNRGFFIVCNPLPDRFDPFILDALSAVSGFQSDASVERPMERDGEKADCLQRKMVFPLLDVLPLPSVLFDESGEPLFWNSAMTRLIGLSREEAGTMDLSFLTDPDNKGITVDMLASENLPSLDGKAFVWPLKRPDGTKTVPCRWHVSMVDSYASIPGGYGYLLTGIPHDLTECASREQDDSPGEQKVIHGLLKVLSSRCEREVTGAFSDLIKQTGLGKEVSFLFDGEQDGQHHKLRDSNEASEHCVSVQFAVRGKNCSATVSQCPSPPLLEAAARLVSSLSMLSHGVPVPSMDQCSLDRSTAGGLVAVISGICRDSMNSGSALINIAGDSDPFMGYARTQLLANENMLRGMNLLRLLLGVEEKLTRVKPDSFLADFHRIFAGKGIRPPVLLLDDRLPSVLLRPDVVCEALAALCQIASGDDVVTIQAQQRHENGTSTIILCIEGLDSDLIPEQWDPFCASPETIALTPSTEAGILLGILSDSGCVMCSRKNESICFALDTSD